MAHMLIFVLFRVILLATYDTSSRNANRMLYSRIAVTYPQVAGRNYDEKCNLSSGKKAKICKNKQKSKNNLDETLYV